MNRRSTLHGNLWPGTAVITHFLHREFQPPNVRTTQASPLTITSAPALDSTYLLTTHTVDKFGTHVVDISKLFPSPLLLPLSVKDQVNAMAILDTYRLQTWAEWKLEPVCHRTQLPSTLIMHKIQLRRHFLQDQASMQLCTAHKIRATQQNSSNWIRHI